MKISARQDRTFTNRTNIFYGEISEPLGYLVPEIEEIGGWNFVCLLPGAEHCDYHIKIATKEDALIELDGVIHRWIKKLISENKIKKTYNDSIFRKRNIRYNLQFPEQKPKKSKFSLGNLTKVTFGAIKRALKILNSWRVFAYDIRHVR